MNDPEQFSTAVAAVLERNDSPHIRTALTGILEAHAANQRRRAAVLEHEDLRRRLEHDLGYQRADQWNGFVPPATVNAFSTDELCRIAGKNGQVRLNQRGAYGTGEMPNDSPRRRILLEISAEAWDRSSGA